MKIEAIKSIIISRTDAIGDVILTLPLCGLLKAKDPTLKVYFLGKSYTEAIINSCSHVDEFLNVDSIKDLPNADAIVHVFPNKYVAQLAKRQNIKFRIGTRNRLFHWRTCNVLATLSRKKSDLHEAQLNIKLVADYFSLSIPKVEELWKYYGFNVQKTDLPTLAEDKKNIILHPKSRGSAREWPLISYDALLNLIPTEKYNILLCGTEAEGELIKEELPQLWESEKIINLCGQLSLKKYINLINNSDVLIACSTGPLHIAAACGIHAIGIYPSIRPIHPERWGPIGQNAEFLKDLGVGGTTTKSDSTIMLDGVTPESVFKKIG